MINIDKKRFIFNYIEKNKCFIRTTINIDTNSWVEKLDSYFSDSLVDE
jgi:hypothetical protein